MIALNINNYLDESFAVFFYTFIVIMIPIILLILALLVLKIIGKWQVFKKAGVKPWKSIIPIYDAVVMCQIVGISPWWVLISTLGSFVLGAIPYIGVFLSVVLNCYLTIVLNISLARSFNKETGFGIGLWLLSPIFLMILGCNKDKYVGAHGIDPLGNAVGLTPINNENKNTYNVEKNNKNVIDNVEVKESAEDNINYCPNCGKKVRNNENYCPYCGQKIK